MQRYIKICGSLFRKNSIISAEEEFLSGTKYYKLIIRYITSKRMELFSKTIVIEKRVFDYTCKDSRDDALRRLKKIASENGTIEEM